MIIVFHSTQNSLRNCLDALGIYKSECLTIDINYGHPGRIIDDLKRSFTNISPKDKVIIAEDYLFYDRFRTVVTVELDNYLKSRQTLVIHNTY